LELVLGAAEEQVLEIVINLDHAGEGELAPNDEIVRSLAGNRTWQSPQLSGLPRGTLNAMLLHPRFAVSRPQAAEEPEVLVLYLKRPEAKG